MTVKLRLFVIEQRSVVHPKRSNSPNLVKYQILDCPFKIFIIVVDDVFASTMPSLTSDEDICVCIQLNDLKLVKWSGWSVADQILHVVDEETAWRILYRKLNGIKEMCVVGSPLSLTGQLVYIY